MKTEKTIECEKAIYYASGANGLGIYGCFEVSLGAGYGNERVDYMTMDSEGIFRCFEIKVSKADFKSKAIKSFLGHYNYFVIPDELYEKIKEEDSFKTYLISGIGLYLVKNKVAYLKRKAKKKSGVNFNIPILMQSMIRSLSRYCIYEFEKVIK